MTNINKKIRCADCIYAKPDISANQYTQKHCKTCEKRDECEVCRDCEYYDTCQARINPKLVQSCECRSETVCCKQTLKLAAIECRYSQSEYFKSLLNVTPGGDRQNCIAWSGCPFGKRGERS